MPSKDILHQRLASTTQAKDAIQSVEEEIRLALTNPAYESHTSKSLQAMFFFNNLFKLVKKEILLLEYFILSEQQRISEIQENIEREEDYQDKRKSVKEEKKDPYTSLMASIHVKINELKDWLIKMTAEVNQIINLLKNNIARLDNEKEKIVKEIEVKKSEAKSTSKMDTENVHISSPIKILVPTLPSDENPHEGNMKSLELNEKDVKSKYHKKMDLNIEEGKDTIDIDPQEFAKTYLEELLRLRLANESTPLRVLNEIISNGLSTPENLLAIDKLQQFVSELNIGITTGKAASSLSDVKKLNTRYEILAKARTDYSNALENAEKYKNSLNEIYEHLDNPATLSANEDTLNPSLATIEEDLVTLEEDITQINKSETDQMSDLQKNLDISSMLDDFDENDLKADEGVKQGSSTAKVLHILQPGNGMSYSPPANDDVFHGQAPDKNGKPTYVNDANITPTVNNDHSGPKGHKP